MSLCKALRSNLCLTNILDSMAKIERTASSQAVKIRTAWCFLILKGKRGFEIHVLWKDSRNCLELFQVKRKDKKGKTDFGLIVRAHIIKAKNDKGEMGEYYQVYLYLSTSTVIF